MSITEWLKTRRTQLEIGKTTLDMTHDTIDSFQLGHDCMRHYAGSTASINFRKDGVFLITAMHQSVASIQKMSDQFIPDKYRKLFTNIPSGFVPMPVIEIHVRDTLRIVISLIEDDLIRNGEIQTMMKELSGHHKRIHAMTATVEEIQSVLSSI
jgi:hypothetical protein